MKLLHYLKFDIVILISIVIFNYFVVVNSTTIAREVYTVLFLFIIPGLLLTSLVEMKTKNYWEHCLLVIGLSTCFLLFAGLTENFLLHAFLIHKPLETLPLLYFFDCVFGLLLVIHITLPKKRLPFNISFSQISFFDFCFIFISSLLPLLAILGAISLNNGGSNLFIIILLSLIPIILLGLILFEERIHENTYYWYILTTSISLLLMLSLRSWHISGWDINDEFRIFQLTKNNGFWSPLFNHAYNACLSLTILPTVISVLTRINDEYIYKLALQILFGLTPIALYSLYRNFSTRIVSLLAIFYIIAQPFFIQPMTALIRQEVALFFFALTLTVAFSKTLKKSIANTLFILFGMSMVVSHYSTTYVTLGLFIASFIFIAFFRAFTKQVLVKKLYESIKNFRFNVSLNRNIQAIPLLILLAFTYFWFFQFTQTSGNVVDVFSQTIANFKNTFKHKQQGDETRKSLAVFKLTNANTVENIHAYVELQSQKFTRSIIPTYNVSPSAIKLYPVNNIEVKPFVKFSSVNRWFNNFLNIIKLITKVIVFLGPLLLLFKYLPKSSDKEFIILNTAGVALVVLVIVHPTLGEAYNLSRVYLQILFIAALGSVVCILTFFPMIGNKIKYLLVGLIFSCMFMLLSGLSAQMIGGFAFMHLNNFGDDYDKFYTHDQEVYSARWLVKNSDKRQFIFTDDVSNLRLLSFANIPYALPVLVPSAMYRNSYVYARYANVIRLRTDADLSGVHLEYTFPMKFLNDNKNLIYNNGGSKIYR
ncbi:MAG TPA: DUF2206 domain-containing protein [Candidatus Saccharimonadales bacterium]|nr:DUF2206 domain-containing protein [Candidatus Saccharimonadales bacterium]